MFSYILSADDDYMQTHQMLTFDSSNTVNTVNVSINVNNDTTPEDDETFAAILSFPGDSIPVGVILDPNTANVTILEIIGEGIII